MRFGKKTWKYERYESCRTKPRHSGPEASREVMRSMTCSNGVESNSAKQTHKKPAPNTKQTQQDSLRPSVELFRHASFEPASFLGSESAWRAALERRAPDEIYEDVGFPKFRVPFLGAQKHRFRSTSAASRTSLFAIKKTYRKGTREVHAKCR